jgi:hypothetical protein
MPPLYYPVIRCILSTDKGNLKGFAVLVLAVLLFHLIVSLQQYGHAEYNRLAQHLLGDSAAVKSDIATTRLARLCTIRCPSFSRETRY